MWQEAEAAGQLQDFEERLAEKEEQHAKVHHYMPLTLLFFTLWVALRVLPRLHVGKLSILLARGCCLV